MAIVFFDNLIITCIDIIIIFKTTAVIITIPAAKKLNQIILLAKLPK